MSQNELKRKGTDRTIRRNSNSEILQGAVYESPSGSRNNSQQFHTDNGAQQFRGSNDQAGLYRSEDRRQEYQSTSQSFNEQRHLYAEQAMNAKREEPPVSEIPVNVSTGYDYQAVIYMPEEDTENRAEFRRYISDSYGTGLGQETREETVAAGKEFGRASSIFTESDVDLANAIDYLDKDNKSFGKKLDHIEKKQTRTEANIKRLEENKLEYRNSYKPWKYRLIYDRDDLNYYKNLCHPHEKQSWHNGRLSDRILVTHRRKIKGRLKFQYEKIAYTDRKHGKYVSKSRHEEDRKRYRLKETVRGMGRIASGSEFEEDELVAALKRRGRILSGSFLWSMRKKVRSIKNELDGYNRLKFQNTRKAALNARTERLNYQSGIELQKRKAEEAAKQGLLREENKRKVKKQMVREYKREQGNFFQRTNRQHQLKKTVKKETKMKAKRVKTLVSSAIAIIAVLILVFFSVSLFFMVIMEAGSESYINSTSQNDYQTMTEATVYFREKEAELEEMLKPENIEPVILEENSEIFEFIYDLDEISFDANTLIAYLSAKYNEFNLEMVSSDLDELFEQYYTFRYEIRFEEREVEDTTQMPDPVTGEYPKVTKTVPICYIILEKQDFYELCKNRIDDGGKQNQMDAFYLTGNGQQIYGPVMTVDWRNKISSNYGWRIHPITGVKTFHDGVDIAVPTGTALYSPVKGKVISSAYSDSAGNMITIENETGWQITFMHMDSRTVQAGETIEQGQRVGYSGNTGNSTGPHLHIRVHDLEGNPINPVFIIPFSTIEESETF